MNVLEIYSIRKVNDVQISYLDNEKSNNLTFRTFLGFDAKFRCMLAFDYLSRQSSDLFIEFKFNNEMKIPVPKSINSNMYYLEIGSLFDSTTLFS